MLVTCTKTFPEYFISGKQYVITEIQDSVIVIVDEQGEGWWPINTVKEYLNLARLNKLKAFW